MQIWESPRQNERRYLITCLIVESRRIKVGGMKVGLKFGPGYSRVSVAEIPMSRSFLSKNFKEEIGFRTLSSRWVYTQLGQDIKLLISCKTFH